MSPRLGGCSSSLSRPRSITGRRTPVT
jgi:hypothetical protein